MRRLLAVTGTLALFGAGVLVAATPAAATAKHVGVVVRYANGHVSAGCATPGGSGLQVLEQHHNVVLGTQQYSGFVLRIDGTGTSRPDNTHYWSYWHAGSAGYWTYSSSGAASTHPKAGTVEGWSYVNGQSTAPRPPHYTYAALCGHLDPKPSPRATPTTSSAQPATASSTARTTPSSVPRTSSAVAPPPPMHTHAASSHSSAAPPPPPTKSTPAKARTSAPTVSSQPSIETAGTSTAATKHSIPRTPSRRAQSPVAVTRTEPTASSGSGFPALGTIIAIAVVAALAGTAWALTRRRAN